MEQESEVATSEGRTGIVSRAWQRVRDSVGRDAGVAYLLIVVLGFFNVLPMLAVLFSSFFAEGFSLYTEFTLRNWELLFLQEFRVIRNTVIYMLAAAFLATTLSAVLGWVIARTDAPFGRLYYYLILFTFFLPPVVSEHVWTRLLAEGGLYPHLLGIHSFPVFTLGGMAVLQAFRLVPLGILLLIPLYSGIDKTLEDVSRTAGAGLFTTARRITIPLVLPGLAAVFLFTLIISVGSFRIPLIIGVPAQIRVLASEIFLLTADTPVEFGVAMAQGTLMVLFAIPLLFGYKRFLGKTEKYQTVSGRGYSRQPTPLGAWRWVVSGAVGFYVLVTMVIPVLLMVYTALVPFYIPPHRNNVANFLEMASFEPFVTVLTAPATREAILNTTIVSFTGATLVTVAPLVISWVVQKTEVRYRQGIDYLAFAPIGLPSVALALGVIFIWSRVITIGVSGTLAIFVIAYFTRSVAVNLRIIDPAVIQINREFLEASQLSGASLFRTIRSVLSPLVMNSMRIAWITSFAFMTTELAIALLLRSPGTELVSAALYRLGLATDTLNQAYALGLTVTVALLVVTLVVEWLTRVQGMEML